jgi:hypothetical protein
MKRASRSESMPFLRTDFLVPKIHDGDDIGKVPMPWLSHLTGKRRLIAVSLPQAETGRH